MAAALTDTTELEQLIKKEHEWLVVRENGASGSAAVHEIELFTEHGRTRFGFITESGFRSFGLRSWSCDGSELELEIATQFGRSVETIRLVPRTSSAALSLEVELARTKRAGEIANMVAEHLRELKLKRVSLNVGNGRIAEAMFEDKNGHRVGMISDVTETLTPESLLATAFVTLERLRARGRRPVECVVIAGARKQARPLQKLCGLLRNGAQSDVLVIRFDETKAPACRTLRSLRVGDLWRERPKKLLLPAAIAASSAAQRVCAAAPEQTDVLLTRQGETIRYHGLPFARVRTMLRREKTWIGVERERTPLTEDNAAELAVLVRKLSAYRRHDPENRHHRYYQMSPEAWLESLLLRNIKLLDPNLILSPIYNQFRASNDKIDLLALRRDGRLVIIEVKTSPDRDMVLQAADYWRKIELQRRSGQLAKARVFGDLEILDKPALVYAVAPALSFHRDFEFFARRLSPEIELWRFELHEDWRNAIKVIGRRNYSVADPLFRVYNP